MKNFNAGFLILTIMLTNSALAFAQEQRGAGNVKVTDSKGKTREVKLYDGSFALVIGMSKYTAGWDNLDGVKIDVVEVGDALAKNGFTVESEMDLKSDALQKRIGQFISDYGYTKNNRLLIYFAGHGHTQKSLDGRDLGYIIPVDTPLPEDDAINFKRKAIPMDEIQNYARRIEAKHALFVFDSCFSGKLVSREKTIIPPVIREDVTYPTRQFITAGAANQKVPDDSIFRRAFVRALDGEADYNRDGFITGTELAAFLKNKVTNASDGAQTPQYGKIRDIELERGDFIFTIPTETDDTLTAKTKITSKIAPPTKITPKISPATTGWKSFRGKAKNLMKYTQVDNFSEGLALVTMNKNSEYKYGFIDENGNEIIAPQYDDAEWFAEGLAVVGIKKEKKDSDKKYGYIDKTGRVVISLKYDNALSFSGYFKSGKYGVDNFSKNYTSVRMGNILGGLEGIIDKTGREIVEPKYSRFDFITESNARAVSENGWVCLDLKTGLEIGGYSSCQKSKSTFIEGLEVVQSGSKYGIRDKAGREIVAPKYELIYSFSDSLAWVCLGKSRNECKYGLVDKSGREVVAPKYDSWGRIAFLQGAELPRIPENFYPVAQGGDFTDYTGHTYEGTRVGLIDKSGREVVAPKYSKITGLSEDLLAVRMGWNKNYGDGIEKWGVIETNGREILPIKYDSVRIFSEKIIQVSLSDQKLYKSKVGFFDIAGNEVTPIKYDDVWCKAFVKEGFIGVVLNGKKGFVDFQGNEYFDF